MKAKERSRTSLALACTAVLFVTSGALGAFEIYREHPQRAVEYLVAVAVPGSASLILLGIVSAVPSLIPEGRFRFPVNLTLPPLFALITLMAKMFWTYPSNALERPPPLLALAVIWDRPEVLLCAAFFQCVVLTLLVSSDR